MTPPDICIHAKLTFGSGDYYLFCQECGAWWGQEGAELRSARARIGKQGNVGQQLSGKTLPSLCAKGLI
jgi:hypothetical protein